MKGLLFNIYFKKVCENCTIGSLSARCRNMSGHTMVGRPAARLETMGFIDKLVCLGRCINKRRVLSLYGLFIYLCDDPPVFLTGTTY